jgi:hypothetical protein
MLVFLQYVLFEKDAFSAQNNNFVDSQIFGRFVEFGKCRI